MSSSTVTYMSISFDSDLPLWGFHLMDPDEFEAPEEAPQSPEQAPPSLDFLLDPEHPEYVAPSNDEIPGDPKEDPKEDPTDYLADGGDGEEEDESSKDDEEENLALADSWNEALIAEYASAPTPPSPPPSLLSPLLSLIHRILSPPLLLPYLHTSPTYASVPLGYKAAMVMLRVASLLPVPSPPLLLTSANRRSDILKTDMLFWKRVDYEFIDTLDASIQASEGRVMTAVGEVDKREWSRSEDRSTNLEASIRTLEARKMVPNKTTTPMTDATINQLIAQYVADALAEYEATRNNGNAYDIHDSGSGRRTERATRECTFSDFLKCQSLNFKGTEGVVGLTQCALTWWSSHVKTVGHDAAYGMTWKILKKMMTDKNNHTQQQPHKRQNVARAYTAGPGKMREYGGSLPLFTQCNYHHNGLCAPKCNNCKKVSHLAHDCRNQAATFNNQRAPKANQRVVTCFECEVLGHYKKYCPKLKNNNYGNPARNDGATTRAYAVGNAGKNSDSNVVTDTFLLNKRYASILFDTGADRIFVFTAFSSLIDIVPTTLDHDYDVELADGKIIGVNTIIGGCTLDFLNHPFNIDLMPVELDSFDVIIEDMDQDSAHIVAASKVPMLKPDEFEIWRIRIKQYIQMMDYTLWEVIENGATLPRTQVVDGVISVMPITTVEEKAQRRLKVKARSTLMMGIFNEHQLQKLVSQLELLDEKLSQEDVNQKLLRSLSLEWNTHVVVWRNKADMDTISMDDLYNNLKDLEQIHPDDMEEIDLRWQMAMLTIRAKSGVLQLPQEERLARECRALRNQDNKHREITRRSVHVETPASTTLLSCDGLCGYDWSDREEEGPNYALMAYTSSCSGSKIVDNCKKGLGYENYNAVPPPYTGNFMPPKPDLSFTGLDEFANKLVAENTKSSEEETKATMNKLIKGMLLLEETPKEGKSQENVPLKLLIDESQVLLRVPRKNNMYSVDLKNIVPKGGLTCLFVNATSDESKLWHRRLGHFNFKTMNKLVKENLVRGLPSKLFKNDQNRVACQKGKQHRASCKTKTKNSISLPLHLFHMDLFGLTFVKLLMKKMYCLVVTDDYSRFSESTPNVVGSGPDWLFDIDALTRTMHYEPIVADPKSSHDDGFKPSSDDGKKVDEDLSKRSECNDQKKEDNVISTNNVNTISLTVSVADTNRVNAIGKLSFDPDMPDLEDVGTFDFSNKDEDDDAVADINNLDITIQVSPTPTTRIHKDHPLDQVIEDLQSATQTRNMTKNLEEHGFVSIIQQRANHKDL
uniref:Reverse transcriptase domain-containing protein n=1 Tax=Tanacetum cinerariifolium TaxID=118510 RepID=A0A699GSQ0_TANCI|nr:reverse transcriptase domain-containing protein [Tanacetum cinerariifolium]